MFKILVEEEVLGSNIFTIRFKGKLPDKYRKAYDDFFSTYSMVNLREASLPLVHPLKPKHERECRFCGNKFPAVTFKKRAHLVPELIGNKGMFSDFECDTCNGKFGKNENDLANFLGLTRSFTGKKGKTGVPKFESPDKTLIIKEGFLDESDLNKKIIIESHGEGNDHFVFDTEKNQLVVNAIRHSYIPFNVYKALLKVGLSMIDDHEVSKYSKAIKILMDEAATQTEAVPFFFVPVFVCPGPPFPAPLIMLFEKMEPNKLCPTHIVVLYFHNYIYQIVLPFYDDDMWMADGKQIISFLTAPPFIDEGWAEHFGYPSMNRLNFSNKEKKKADKQVVTFKFDKAFKF